MSELITWLRAQLDEDERVALEARRVAPGTWVPMYRDIHAVQIGPDAHTQQHVATAETGGLAVHVVRWDPARVLAEVEAKRRLLDEAIRLMSYDGEFEFVELLAQPYAGRDGWREEWRA